MWRLVVPVLGAVVIGYVFAREDMAEGLCKERGIKPPALKPGFGALALVAFLVFLIYGVVFFHWYVALGLVVGGFFATIGVAALLNAVAGPWLRRRAIAALARAGVDVSAIPPVAPPAAAPDAGTAAAAGVGAADASAAADSGGPGQRAEDVGATPEERLWQSRTPIAALEDVKNRAIALLEADAGLDAPTRTMWIGDLKETYYSVVMAHQLLRAERRGNALVMLGAAKSRMEQAASELIGLKSEAGGQLEAELRRAFTACDAQLRAVPGEPPAPPPPPPVAPEHRVVRAGEDEWQVLCQVCGALAMRFTIGAEQVMGVTVDEAPHVVYGGLTKRTTFELDRKERAWALLGADDLKGLHTFVSDLGQFDGGLDAYCPKCDKVYCGSHYATAETWDEGFYDCTYGTCPEGHRRIIDD